MQSKLEYAIAMLVFGAIIVGFEMIIMFMIAR